MDSLSLKASEVFSLQTEAEFKAKEDIAKNGILKGYNSQTISDLTGLTIEQIEKLRNETDN